MIVFGHNSFTLNACKPSQLGLPEELDQLYTIERRQRYFHLFWIPTFGIGKIWALRKKSDDQLYNPNPELEKILNSLPFQEKTPWYTFSLLILGLAGGLIFLVQDKISDYQREQYYEASRLEKNQKLTDAIGSPQPYHYYDMESEHDHVFLKVLSSDTRSILFQIGHAESNDYSEYKLLKAFVADSALKVSDTVRILKTDMLSTINKEDSYSFKGHEIINEAALKIYEFKEFPFPVFESMNAGFEEGKFYAVLRNIGGGAHFAKLNAEPSNVVFESNPFPSNVPSGEYLFIEGSYSDAEPQLRAEVKLHNTIQDTIAYDLNIYGAHVSIKKSDNE